jgi:hypothetical protein
MRPLTEIQRGFVSFSMDAFPGACAETVDRAAGAGTSANDRQHRVDDLERF